MLDRDGLKHAFELLGEDLSRRGLFVELAVYGGSAIMLQFEWRRTTEDVDAVVREGYDEAALRPSVERVASDLGLSHDWLNNAVGMYTPLNEEDALFAQSGSYPMGDRPGLRILVARPGYLLAMKLQALSNLSRGERDLADARALADELAIAEVADLAALYASIHDEQPSRDLVARFAAVVKGP